jgi:thiol-disulfide isomerase/thioredoxin
MYERLLIVIAAVCLSVTFFLLLRWLQLQRAQNAANEQNVLQLKGYTRHVVYFWSEHCPQCKSAQKPTLDRLLAKVREEDVKIITIQVEDYEELAKSWGVRTLPTTYILDRQGNVSHINNGFASESRLLQQLELVTT